MIANDKQAPFVTETPVEITFPDGEKEKGTIVLEPEMLPEPYYYGKEGNRAGWMLELEDSGPCDIGELFLVHGGYVATDTLWGAVIIAPLG